MTQDTADIYMLSEMARVRTACTAVTPVHVVHLNIGTRNAEQLLLIYAKSGGDTRSATYGLGKSTVFSSLTGTQKRWSLTECRVHQLRIVNKFQRLERSC